MNAFVAWFNDTAPNGKRSLPALTRAGIAHLYFVRIHPFEDGNGRVSRALAEKTLAQNFGQPTLIALSYTIERARKDYYAALERNNKDTAITEWLCYFGETVLEAQRNTLGRVEFYLAKARLYERLRGQLNARQEKAIARMSGRHRRVQRRPERGKLYHHHQDLTRDRDERLQDLVAKGALSRTGELRHTRNRLTISSIAHEGPALHYERVLLCSAATIHAGIARRT